MRPASSHPNFIMIRLWTISCQVDTAELMRLGGKESSTQLGGGCRFLNIRYLRNRGAVLRVHNVVRTFKNNKRKRWKNQGIDIASMLSSSGSFIVKDRHGSQLEPISLILEQGHRHSSGQLLSECTECTEYTEYNVQRDSPGGTPSQVSTQPRPGKHIECELLALTLTLLQGFKTA